MDLARAEQTEMNLVVTGRSNFIGNKRDQNVQLNLYWERDESRVRGKLKKGEEKSKTSPTSNVNERGRVYKFILIGCYPLPNFFPLDAFKAKTIGKLK